MQHRARVLAADRECVDGSSGGDRARAPGGVAGEARESRWNTIASRVEGREPGSGREQARPPGGCRRRGSRPAVRARDHTMSAVGHPADHRHRKAPALADARTASPADGLTIASIRSWDSRSSPRTAPCPARGAGSRRGRRDARAAAVRRLGRRARDARRAEVLNGDDGPVPMSSRSPRSAASGRTGRRPGRDGRLDRSWSPNIATGEHRRPADAVAARRRAVRTRSAPTPSATARMSSPPRAGQHHRVDERIAFVRGSNTSSPPTVGTPTQLP